MTNQVLDNVTINQPVANDTAKSAIPTSSLATGVVVFQTDEEIWYEWNGSAWVNMPVKTLGAAAIFENNNATSLRIKGAQHSSEGFSLASATAGAAGVGNFVINGDQTSSFTAGRTFVITSGGDNNGTYTVTSSSYSSNTTILVEETIAVDAGAGATVALEVQNYAGIFNNNAYSTLGTLKTRAFFGANLEMDLAFQSPHALILAAVDDTQSDGLIRIASKTQAIFDMRADAEVESPVQLIIDRQTTGSTGSSNTSNVVIKTNGSADLDIEDVDTISGVTATFTGDVSGQAGLFTNDNATSLRVRGAQAPSEGGATVQSDSGIFYNDAYVTLGTLKTRVIHGANLEMDMLLQSPHALIISAVDDTQNDGFVRVASKTNMIFDMRADAEVASPTQLIIDRATTGTTGAGNTSGVVLKTNGGDLQIENLTSVSGSFFVAAENGGTAVDNSSLNGFGTWDGAGGYTATAVDDSTIEIDTTLKVKDGGITAAKLNSSSIKTYCVEDGNVTWSGALATLDVSAPGIVATDRVFLTLRTYPTEGTDYFRISNVTTDQFTIELSTPNTSNDAEFDWEVRRSVS